MLCGEPLSIDFSVRITQFLPIPQANVSKEEYERAYSEYIRLVQEEEARHADSLLREYDEEEDQEEEVLRDLEVDDEEETPSYRFYSTGVTQHSRRKSLCALGERRVCSHLLSAWVCVCLMKRIHPFGLCMCVCLRVCVRMCVHCCQDTKFDFDSHPPWMNCLAVMNVQCTCPIERKVPGYTKTVVVWTFDV